MYHLLMNVRDVIIEDSIILTEGKEEKDVVNIKHSIMVAISPRKLIVTTYVNRQKSLMKDRNSQIEILIKSPMLYMLGNYSPKERWYIDIWTKIDISAKVLLGIKMVIT